MAAAFISQQYLQNVLGYSTLEAGAAILPAALVMVVVAPRSAKLVEARGARFTLLAGYVFLLLAFLTMLLVWDEGAPYWQIAAAYVFVGAGVGLAGTPASHSLTGSVPVTRAGMASGTADLQRDLGGAIMQSIFGALLTAGTPRRSRPRSLRPTRASRTRRRRRSRSRSRAPRPSPRSTRSTQPPSSRARRRRFSRVTTGRTSPVSSSSCSAPRSSTSCSRGKRKRRRCSPRTTPRTPERPAGRVRVEPLAADA